MSREEQTVAVVGCGYVGLVTAVGLAETGIRVRAYDVDPKRVAACQSLDFPMVEPGLREAAAAAGERLTFHDVTVEAWPRPSFTFLAVPTPQGEAGYPNLSYLRRALMWIADGHHRAEPGNVIVIRSTVPPGTARWAKVEVERLMGEQVPIVANPEFLQEGRALEDFRHPSRILIGADDETAGANLRVLMSFSDAPVIVTDTATAELAKYGSNAFLAMRISFANEMARLAEREGADPIVTLEAVGMDPRIGSRYLKPGVGYGGSCLPKDVAALISMGTVANEPMGLMRAIEEVNDLQRRRLIRTIGEALDGLSGRRIALLGLAFKPGTNDIRDSPALGMAHELEIAGASVIAWDPAVHVDHLPAGVTMEVTDSLLDALVDVDAAVLCTEWPEAVSLDFHEAGKRMRGTLLVDGRYAWSGDDAFEAGLDLVRIGTSRPVNAHRVANS